MFELLWNTLMGSVVRYVVTGGVVMTLIGGNAIQYYRYKSLKGEYKTIQVQIDECTSQLKVAHKAGDNISHYTEGQDEAMKNYYEKLLQMYRDHCGTIPADSMQR